MLDFMIIGAQKSASTFIHRCLEEHPEVYMPQDEISVFENPDYHMEGLKKLETIIENSNAPIKGIKRPNYLAKEECPKRIRGYSENIKLIVVLRNPVNRTISAYYHYMRMGFLPITPLEEGIKSILNGSLSKKYQSAKDIIEYGYYYKHIDLYLKYFNKNQILVMFDEDIKMDSINTLKRVYNFLGIQNKTYIPNSLTKKPNMGMYNLNRLRINKIKNKIIYKYNKTNTRLTQRSGPIINLSKILFRGIDELVLKRIFSEKKPELSFEIKSKLYSVYEEDLNNLEKLLKINLSHWKV
ncbi:hypothetical protein GCM10008986_09880 [Salinibacillus aidingensis]|uniref:Sulfotransferase domain-containing protein n=1 Tax=Salinibacillus aidingensis TaxID=237684 RepID=A0ABN1B070_9BACI